MVRIQKPYSSYSKEEKEARQDYYKDYIKNNIIGRAGILYRNYKMQDRKKGMEFNVTKDFIKTIISQHCIYCGETSLSKMGLDRLDNSLGHTINNTLPCCQACNMARGDRFTYEEMLEIGQVIKKIKYDREREKSLTNTGNG